MANRDAPMGFLPAGRLDGSQIPVRRFAVDTGNDTNVFVGDLVAAEAEGVIEVADAGEDDTCLGAVVGIVDTNGITIGGPNSLVATKYLPATTAGFVDVALMLPDSVFEAQGNGTSAATDVFNGVDIVATAGDTTTGRSKMEVNSTVATDGQFKIIGKVDDPSNAWGANTRLLLVPQLSYWFDGTAGI